MRNDVITRPFGPNSACSPHVGGSSVWNLGCLINSLQLGEDLRLLVLYIVDEVLEVLSLEIQVQQALEKLLTTF